MNFGYWARFFFVMFLNDVLPLTRIEPKLEPIKLALVNEIFLLI